MLQRYRAMSDHDGGVPDAVFPLTIRRALFPEDVRTFRDIAAESAPLETMSERAYGEATYLFGDLCSVASVGHLSVGFLIASERGRDGFISQVAVLPEHRRRGIAAQMLDRTTVLLAHRGVRDVLIPVPDGDEVSRRMIFRLAERWSTRPGVEGRWEREYRTESILSVRLGKPGRRLSALYL